MISAKKVISENLSDIDSNLNVVYSQLNTLKDLQPCFAVSRRGTTQSTGASSNYEKLILNDSSIVSYSYPSNSLEIVDDNIKIDSAVSSLLNVSVSLDLNLPSNQDALVYIKLGYFENGDFTNPIPYDGSLGVYALNATSVSNYTRRTINYNFTLTVSGNISGYCIMTTTNGSACQINKSNVALTMYPTSLR